MNDIKTLYETMESARIYRMIAKNEKRAEEYNKKKISFEQALSQAQASPVQLQDMSCELKGMDDASKREQLLFMLM